MKYFFLPDLLVIILTLIALAAIVIMVNNVVHSKEWYSVILSALGILLLLYFALRTPYCVKVTEDNIEVKSIIGGKSFNKNNILMERISKKDLSDSYRVFGNGGFGGYVGKFHSPKLGNFKMMVVRQSDMIKITTLDTGEIYVINYPSKLLSDLK